jgi:lipopolysaccharide/colanic/teichoic acid biosynthesis glycosyltransferase
MIRRLFDTGLALGGLVLVSPVLLAAAIGVSLSSPGPILYRARRIARDRRRLAPRGGVESTRVVPDRREVGYRGREFTLYKLRTMHVGSETGAPITALDDTRVFRFGAFLRATKIDELPQLVNVLRGEMAFVGPRPEAPEIVRRHYRPADLETLQVLPGLTSPGSLYYYRHGEDTLRGADVTGLYTRQLLPVKLAIDRQYIQDATIAGDLRVILQTMGVLLGRAVDRARGRRASHANGADRATGRTSI